MFKRRPESKLDPVPRRSGSRAIITLDFSRADEKADRACVPPATNALAAHALRNSRRFGRNLSHMTGLGGSVLPTCSFYNLFTTLHALRRRILNQRTTSLKGQVAYARARPPSSWNPGPKKTFRAAASSSAMRNSVSTSRLVFPRIGICDLRHSAMTGQKKQQIASFCDPRHGECAGAY